MSNSPVFCTLFDSNYLAKGVVMLRSLLKCSSQAEIFVLCMDEFTYSYLNLLSLNGVKLLSLPQVEDERLLKVKSERTSAEYCWTLSPSLPYYLLSNFKSLEHIIYIDADLYFCSSIDPLMQEFEDFSIVVSEHRFPEMFKYMEANGRFCVQWVGFRRDSEGLACLSRWRDECLEWCFNRLEDGKMGDQKYLDNWPSTYSRVKILGHIGAGVAPWNFSNYHFSLGSDGLIKVNGQSLIFYHFHQFQVLGQGKFDRMSDLYRSQGAEPHLLYSQYENEIRRAYTEIQSEYPNFSGGVRPYFLLKLQRFAQAMLPSWLKLLIKKIT